MSDKQKRKKVPVKAFLIGAVIIGCIMAIVVSILKKQREKEEEAALVSEGLAYLQMLEAGDPDEVMSEINAINRKKWKEKLENDETAVWEAFGDAVILGDSRAQNFYFYEFLPESRVLAKKGGNITGVSEYMETLRTLKPSQLFFCYGLNDVEIWTEVDKYIEVCRDTIADVREILPEAEIYINSILPANEYGLTKNSNFSKIGDYNEALKAMCEENGYFFIDNTQIVQDHQDLYEPDGLHFKADFCIYWATNMITETFHEEKDS